MIKMEQQSLALNATKIPGPDYRMDQTIKMPKNTIPTDVVNFIQAALNNISDPTLKNIVINSHGSPGIIYLGEQETVDSKGQTKTVTTFIGIQHLGLFAQFKNKIGTIWLTGCQTAGSATGSSEVFCKTLATTIGCNVVAANVLQYINPGYYLRLFPKNCIDEFEGTAYKWDANGNKTVFSRREWYAL